MGRSKRVSEVKCRSDDTPDSDFEARCGFDGGTGCTVDQDHSLDWRFAPPEQGDFLDGTQGLCANSHDERKQALNAFRRTRWAFLIVAGLLVTSLASEAAEGDIASSQVASVSEAAASQAVEAKSSTGHDDKPSIKEFQSAKGAGPNSIELFATVLFALAILHTFCVKLFAHWAHKYPEGSIAENLLHFLSETEIVFGVWATALFIGIAAFRGSIPQAVRYIESLNYTEPKFVLVVMVVAATRPVVSLAEGIISFLAKLLPLPEGMSFFLTALSVGPLLGSFITEPAAMTLLAIVLKRRYFDQGISSQLAYAALGLLFVNVSIGGTLTHFAAPPVLMVATKWNWDTPFMLSHFGWRAALSCCISTSLVGWIFRKELMVLAPSPNLSGRVPAWLTGLHVLSLAAMVAFAHHPDVFFGAFMMFLGMVHATREYQDPLKLKEGLLVGFFLAGLVTLGSLQNYWLEPLITSLGGSALYFGATGLTAITDNAALTFLGAQVEGISPALKYALAAGAVTGGGLTVIANAPNPAGAGILQSSKVFGVEGISPVGLLCGALFPTLVAIVCFWFLP